MKKYAVFGNPIEHSMSPLIHAYFAENLGIKLTYDAILGTVGKFELEAKNFLKMGGKGFNVTLPFKQEAYNLAETKSEIAEITGVSINTALGRMRYAIINLRKMIEDNQIVLAH